MNKLYKCFIMLILSYAFCSALNYVLFGGLKNDTLCIKEN